MKLKRIIPAAGFTLYLFMLIWLIIFKLDLQIPVPPWLRTRSINLIPFSGSALVNGGLDLKEPLYNFLAFVPLGLYLSILKLPEKPWLRILAGFLLSIAFETAQYAFAIGATDITDLIMNTAGAAVGVLAFELLFSKHRERAGTVISIILLTFQLLAIAGYAGLLALQ